MSSPDNVPYPWKDQAWMKMSASRSGSRSPISIYQVHLSSWMRVPEENNRPLTHAEIAPKLADYLHRLNFTHVEFVPEQPLHRQPQYLMQLIDHLHQSGLGVVLSRLPSQFPVEENIETQALKYFGQYHADLLRLDDSGLMVVPDSNFSLKWDSRWQHDVLDYFAVDPISRKDHHSRLTVRSNYAFSENFVLALPCCEAMHGRQSLICQMFGDEWQKFANMRLLFADMFAQPGKKLTFMGKEFGQWQEWRNDTSLDWHLVQPGNHHSGLQRWISNLNRCYRDEPALHQLDADSNGFEWCENADAEQSTFSWLRKSASAKEVILVVLNCTPVPRHNFRVGVSGDGFWREILNSDAREFGGSGQGNLGGVEAAPFGWQSKSHSLTITLPPLGAVFLKQTK